MAFLEIMRKIKDMDTEEMRAFKLFVSDVVPQRVGFMEVDGWVQVVLPTHIFLFAGRGSKKEADNRAARGRFSIGNLD